VQCLHNATASDEDGIIAPLLKACLKGIEWLHRVIFVVFLFNVFLNFMVRHALNNIQPDSEVPMQFRADGNLFYFVSPGLSLHQIALLFYANDMVFFSTNSENLALILQCMDAFAEWLVMRINVAKTQGHVDGQGGLTATSHRHH
jgi:hypothetical protein